VGFGNARDGALLPAVGRAACCSVLGPEGPAAILPPARMPANPFQRRFDFSCCTSRAAAASVSRSVAANERSATTALPSAFECRQGLQAIELADPSALGHLLLIV